HDESPLRVSGCAGPDGYGPLSGSSSAEDAISDLAGAGLHRSVGLGAATQVLDRLGAVRVAERSDEAVGVGLEFVGGVPDQQLGLCLGQRLRCGDLASSLSEPDGLEFCGKLLRLPLGLAPGGALTGQ